MPKRVRSTFEKTPCFFTIECNYENFHGTFCHDLVVFSHGLNRVTAKPLVAQRLQQLKKCGTENLYVSSLVNDAQSRFFKKRQKIANCKELFKK